MSVAALPLDEGTCSLCMKSLDQPGMGRQWLPCGHVFHEICVTRMRHRGASDCCPSCHEKHEELTPMKKLLDRAVAHLYDPFTKYNARSRLFSEVLDVDPGNAEAIAGMAACFVSGDGVPQDRARAMELYEESRRAGNVHATIRLAVLLQNQGELERSLELFEEAHRGGSAEAAFHLGEHYHTQGDLNRAATFYEEALGKGMLKAACGLGHIHHLWGDRRKAKSLYEDARRDGCIDASCRLGLLYIEEGMIEVAMKLMEEAHRGGNTFSATFLGLFHLERGELQAAVELLEESRVTWNNDECKAPFACQLGDIYVELGELEKAVELYKEAGFAGNAEAAHKLSVLVEKQNQPSRQSPKTQYSDSACQPEGGRSKSVQSKFMKSYPLDSERLDRNKFTGNLSGDRLFEPARLVVIQDVVNEPELNGSIAMVLPSCPNVKSGRLLVRTTSGRSLSLKESNVSDVSRHTDVPPVVVFPLPDVGDCVVATRGFVPGELMWSEPPLLVGTASTFSCDLQDLLRKCKVPGRGSRDLTLDARTLEIVEAFKVASVSTQEKVLKLTKFMEKTAPVANVVSKAASVLSKCAHSSAFVMEDHILEDVLAISSVNSFSYQGRTVALFELGCRMEHACDGGNCTYHVDERGHGNFIARIDVGSGHRLAYGYAPDRLLWRGTDQRQDMLYRIKGFTCMCKLCSTGEDLYRQLWCPQCPHGNCFAAPVQDGSPTRRWLADQCRQQFNDTEMGGILHVETSLTRRAIELDDMAERGRIDISVPDLVHQRDKTCKALGPRHFATGILARMVDTMFFNQHFHPDLGQFDWCPKALTELLESLELNEITLRWNGSKLGAMPVEWDTSLIPVATTVLEGRQIDNSALQPETIRRLIRLLDMARLSIAGTQGESRMVQVIVIQSELLKQLGDRNAASSSVFDWLASGSAPETGPRMHFIGGWREIAHRNAQVGDDLMQRRSTENDLRVLLLKFSRCPASLEKMLLEAEELAPCRDALAAHGRTVKLPSGAKILLHPDHYAPALEAVRLYGWTLYPGHLLVDPELEPVVVQLVQSLPGKQSVYPKTRKRIPLGLAAFSHESNANVQITRTFVHIRLSSSLRSTSDSEAPRTVSTTDADPRKHGAGPSIRKGARAAS